jgi:hypothetical protein
VVLFGATLTAALDKGPRNLQLEDGA